MRVACKAILAVLANALLFWDDGSAFSPTSHVNLRHTNRLKIGQLPLQMSNYKKQLETEQFDFSDPLKPVVFGQRLLIPFTDTSFDFGNLTNQGPFSWMVPYITLFGYKQGNRLVGGVAEKAESSNLSEDEMTALREKAAKDMTNIGDEERARRALYGNYAYVAAGLYAAVTALLIDDGDISGHIIRFAILPILFLARGLQLSAQAGL